MALAPNATQISVRQVLAKLDAEFADMVSALENGEFALWLGSGISRKAPSLGNLIENALNYLRSRAIDPATAAKYRPAFEEALALANIDPAAVEVHFPNPLASWPERDQIINALWNRYSRVLDVRVPGEKSDYILWNAVDIRSAFANPAPPAGEHLCIAILILEGAVRTIASANWDGFIEAAVSRLGGATAGLLQVVVDPNHLRDAPGRAQLLKFHGCIEHATQDEAGYRKYLTGSHTQIMEWPVAADFAAMRSAVVNVAMNQKALVLGLSIQDSNLQGVFTLAKQINPWPWPCAPAAPAHVFCEDEIKQGQRDVLRVVYGNSYNNHAAAIHAASHLRSWAEQVLIALVLRLLTDKLVTLMQLWLDADGEGALGADCAMLLEGLRNSVADLATYDPVDQSRVPFVNATIAAWSRLLSLFRRGALPNDPATYEALSSSPPNMLAADQNAQATGLGRLGFAIAMLQHGRAHGDWELSLPDNAELASGALKARAPRPSAIDRPIFLVKSATEAVLLHKNGAFANDNAIVVHGDDTWQQMVGNQASARQPRAAPGRTGRRGTTHVSIEELLRRSDTSAALQQAFVAEMMI